MLCCPVCLFVCLFVCLSDHRIQYVSVLLCSMFILLEGRTKDEAFVIGQQIADAVTNDNPKPVKLRLEKVLCFTFIFYSYIRIFTLTKGTFLL